MREYVKTRARNEALDCEVYALAALYSLGNMTLRRLGELAEEINEPPDPKQEARPKQEPGARGRGGSSGWVNGWRD